MPIASQAIDAIKAIDLVAHIERSVSLTKRGRYHEACCPFHSEQTPSFKVSAERQTWRCYGACNEGGDIIAYEMKRQSLSFIEAVASLCQQYHIAYERPRREAGEAEAKRRAILTATAEAYQQALKSPTPDAQAASSYAKARGLSDEVIGHWGIGFALPGRLLLDLLARPEYGYTPAELVAAGVASEGERGIYAQLRNRLAFAIHDARGQVVGLAGRALHGEMPKYLNTTFEKSRVVYGLYQAQHAIRSSGEAIIVEGYMDVILCHVAGYQNVVAPMGSGLSAEQAELLQRHGAKRFIIALDGDAAGQAATGRMVDSLAKLAKDIRIAVLPDGKDPDELAREGTLGAVLAAAMPVSAYLFQTRLAGVTRHSPMAERVAKAQELAPILAQVEVDLWRKSNLQELAALLGLDAESVIRLGGAGRVTPALRIVEKPAPEPPPPHNAVQLRLESYVLRGWLVHWSALQRELRLCVVGDVPLRPLERADFPLLAPVWDIMQAAQAQFEQDEQAYVQQHAPDFNLVGESEITLAGMFQTAIKLRVARLRAELDDLTEDLPAWSKKNGERIRTHWLLKGRRA